MTLVYAPGGNTWIDGSHPVRAHGPLAANLVAEGHLARLTSAGGEGVALRFGGFYGADDAFNRDVLTVDVFTALASVLNAPAGISNAVNDDPWTRGDLLAILADASGRQLRSMSRWTVWLASTPVRSLSRSHRVSNAFRPTLPPDGPRPDRATTKEAVPQIMPTGRLGPSATSRAGSGPRTCDSSRDPER